MSYHWVFSSKVCNIFAIIKIDISAKISHLLALNFWLEKKIFFDVLIYILGIRIRIQRAPTKENRIYIRVEFTRKSVKRPFWCTVSILQVYFTYLCYINFWAHGVSFYRKSKINIKRKPNYEIGLFHIISHSLYAFYFTNDDFPL